jgi:UDP-GlcNAc:undecaprenyl-phosphate GlcNAc-1-phosphate transferase
MREVATYGAVFASSLLIAGLLTPLMLRVAVRRGILDAPGGRKVQSDPVPYLGGVAIATAFSVTVLAATLLVQPTSGAGALAAALGAALALSIIGLWDDLRGLGPFIRLAAQVAAGALVAFTSPGLLPGAFPALGISVTVIWVVLVTNAFNLLDNMDGLSAGIATVAAVAFLVIAAVNGQILVAALAAAMAGCTFGFLLHNKHPARIYMGDAGSLFIGFVLAFLGARLRIPDAPALVTFAVPLLVVAVGLFDTSLVVIERLRHGRSPLQGGRDHTSHRLVWIGLPVPAAVGLLYGAGVAAGWLALVVARLDAVTTALLLGLLGAIAIGLLLLLTAVPVYENSRQRRSMVRLVQEHESEPVDDAPS